jgi:hypothetical protein
MRQWARAAKLALGAAAFFGSAWVGCTGNSDPTIGGNGNTKATSGAGAADTSSGTATGGAGGSGGADVCPGGKLCGNECTNTQFDLKNCGECGKACPMGQVCSQGKCEIQCLGGSTKCGDKCTNTDNDPKNCGMCDKACAMGEVCAAGKCALTCEAGGTKQCKTGCVDIKKDPKNCGDCEKACDAGLVCNDGKCELECTGGTQKCSGVCVDVANDPKNCGMCGKTCDTMKGEVCSQGVCSFSCIGGTTDCSGTCVDTMVDPKNCGMCGKLCKDGEVCTKGACASVCGQGLTKCGLKCIDTMVDKTNCGMCGTICKNVEKCEQGKCVVCDSKTTDCDGDGWLASEGDCCDAPGSCGADPALVNPGAMEVTGNGVDDNCNGKQDFFDTQDTAACDALLGSNPPVANDGDYAKALGICRNTTENPALKKDKTWGLIEAKLLRADGSVLGYRQAASIRNTMGSLNPPNTEGQKSLLLSTGIAADATQTNPGPNEVKTFKGTAHTPASSVDISTCNNALCIKDWFTTANGNLKKANELPVAPNCGSGSAGNPKTANDSVMLELRLRAPTNARAFSLNTYFMSAEFPGFVCTNYNDQFIVLIDTFKNGQFTQTSPIPNPVDKNLMIYTDKNGKWPIGINLASATGLFNVCDLAAAQGANPKISGQSCSLGKSQLVNTGYDSHGGSFWLTTSGNVIPGEIVTVRIVIWDVSDSAFDSLAILDGFKWLPNATAPGTDD